ncbi:MAG: hypothetical protein ACOH2L_06660 [Devosia sp.]
MTRQQEKLLVAALCGIAITAAAALVVQPAMATGDQSARTSLVTHFAPVAQAFVDAQTALPAKQH